MSLLPASAFASHVKLQPMNRPASHLPAAFAASRATSRASRHGMSVLLASALVFLAGCATVSPPTPPAEVAKHAQPGPQTLSPGDVIKISFPGAANLETTQQIRRDGCINLSSVGEVKAADKTPGQLEAELKQLYASQLVSKEINVTVVTSSFAVFVTGAVLKPGKILPDRAVTALEAIMEAGGFDNTTANSRAVVVIRHEDGQTKNYTLDLKAALEGKPTEPFYLKSHDIVYVPEKFSWF